MYTIKAFVNGKDYMIHNPRVKELIVGDPYFEIGDNVNGKAEFSVYPTHPYYQYVRKLTTDIVFYNDGVEKFAGRVLYDDEDSNGTKKVFVEGELAYLCDSVQKPAVYHNISVKDYFKTVIDIHNSQVEERKKFVVGRVSVTDPNDSLYRYSNWETTRDTLSDKLIDRLGGHLVIRKENGIRYLDYLNDDEFYHKSTQEIRFGKNLLDYSKNVDASDLKTCIIPLGAKLDESSIEGLEERLTIESVNGGVNYVSDDNAVAEYGKIFDTVTWDDVTVAANLLRKGREYLKTVQFEKMVLELKAIDLNLTNSEIEELKVGSLVRCVSAPHGMDATFPITSLKIYITSFAKNTITLNSEKDNTTYTSSNGKKTQEIEKTIENLPSKSEILEEALRDATSLMNDLNKTGNAIHTKSEFIVSDTPGVENAKNLWRWGLAGLAHYSNGYNGPVDGVALTMDGKINGKMVMANTIMAEAIDVGYKKSVSDKITESTKNANDHADEAVKNATDTINVSISDLENKIGLRVENTKEIIARRNYITGGEEEKLNIGNFSISGSASVVKAEYLNENALKITFTASGTCTISQSVGILEAGNYEVNVSTAFDNPNTRPSYIQYGFSGNLATTYLSGYKPKEYITLRRKVNITRASKTVSIIVGGSKGNVIYVTNIRCLRDIQGLFDDVNAKVDVEVGKVSASVNEVYENSQHNYCDNGDFSNSDDNFQGWVRGNSNNVTKTTINNKSCVKITNSSNLYWKQSNIQKRMNIKVRFKARCDPGQEKTAQIRLTIDEKAFYTDAGTLRSDSWTTYSYENNVTPSFFYTYFYSNVNNTTVYITDVEILGYISSYSEAQIAILKDSITQEVTRAGKAEETLSGKITTQADEISARVKKGEFGSYMEQYYNRVLVGFNNSSKYIQINAGEIGIYDYGIENSKKRAVFDENGNHFYRDGYYVGKIGTNQWSDDETQKGLVFDLEAQGKYIAFAQKKSASANAYTTMLCFSRANSIYDEYGVNMGCNLIGNWYTLKNFNIGAIAAGGYNGMTGTIPIITSIESENVAYHYSKIRVFNGIVAGYWN